MDHRAQAADGKWVETSEDCLNILVDKHFPSRSFDISGRSATNCLPLLSEDLIRKITDPKKIIWPIDSFLPFKGTGTYEIYPAMLQFELVEFIGNVSKELLYRTKVRL